MARCNCNGQTCGCVIRAGAGITITGAGTANSELVISASGEGGGGGGGAWDPGDLKQVAHGRTPPGWLECLGQAVSRAAYPALFAEVGTTYGLGDGSTTFNLPNYAGRFLAGAGSGYVLGAAGGTAETTLAIPNLPPHTHTIAHQHYMDHQHGMGNHTHSDAHGHGNTTTASSNHTHNVTFELSRQTNTTTGGGGTRATGFGGGSGSDTKTAATTAAGADHVHGVPDWNGRTDGPTPGATDTANRTYTEQPTQASSGSTGAATPFTNLPPYRVVRVLIKT